jgi:hypothetical protein
MDAALLLALAAAAGVAAGGSHVAAALLLELVRGRRYRALVLLSFPALFFPVALAERAIEAAGWARATAATLAVCTLAGAGLLCLPESPAFLKARAAAAAAAAAATESPARAPALIDVLEAEDGGTSDDVDESSLDGLPEGRVSASAPPGFGLGDAVLTPAAERRLLLQRCSRRLHVERGSIDTAAIWLLLTPSIYLSSMVSYLVPNTGGAGGGDSDGDAGQLCGAARAEPLFGSAAVAAAAAAGASDSAPRIVAAAAAAAAAAVLNASGSNASLAAALHVCAVAEPALKLFALGLHVVSAELLALLLCALLIGSRVVGTRSLLALSLGASALALVLAAAASRALGCNGDVSGSLARAGVEFLVRLTLSLAAQSLFLFTLESGAARVRGRAAGAAIAVFRLGALITLASSPRSEQRQALMWSVFAVTQPLGLLFGLAPDSVEHTAAATAVLAVSSQLCFLGACLASCLPKATARREEEGEEGGEGEEGEENGARRHAYAPVGAAAADLESPAAVGRLGGFGGGEASDAAGPPALPVPLARPPADEHDRVFLARVLWRWRRQGRVAAPPLSDEEAEAEEQEGVEGVEQGEEGGDATAAREAARLEAVRLRLLRRMRSGVVRGTEAES